MACVGNGVGCIAGEAGAGAVVGGAAVVADERPDVGSNRATAASAGDSGLVSGVLMGVRADAGTPATIPVMLHHWSGGAVGPLHPLAA